MREFDARAVSTTVGYALTLGVTALLVTGLLIAGGGFLQEQRETSTRSELEVIGHQVASDIASADRLAGADVTEVSIRRSLPQRVTGSAYSITVENSPQLHLVLTSADPEVTVRIDAATEFVSNGVVSGTVDGGNIVIEYDTSNDQLVIDNA
jgi:hypothetical protein